MARQRTRQPEPPNGFVASAVRLPTANQAQAGKPAGWQSQAWAYYDSIGELRYLANWIGNVMSRATLHAAKRDGNSLVPLTSGPAREAMDALYGGPQQQAQMIQLLGVDMTVSGEGYITARGDDVWDVLATGAVTQDTRGNLHADFGGSQKRTAITKDDLVIRVWTPHPTDPTQADAPTRSNMKTMAQIVGYDDHISAQLTSRLAGAGILFLPSEIQFAAPADADPAASQADQFLQKLAEAMMAPIADRASPAAFVPVVVTAPGEFLDKAQHMRMWSDLDEAVVTMRSSAIQRFAIGMDVPADVLLGIGDANHWNAWLTEESAIKSHLEPRLAVINAALTTSYLRPSLQGVVPEDEIADYYVIADTSEIRARPNRGTEALELNDRGLINQTAVLRETGFKAEDLMQGDEYRRWLLQRIATGAVTPELTAQALNILGAGIDVAAIGVEPQGQPDSTRTDTAINDDGQRGGIPEQSDSTVPLVAACEVLVYRALERAGNKLRNLHPRTDTAAMTASEVYTILSGDESHLLEGSWDCAAKVLDGYECDVDAVVQVLDFYTRGLLSQKRPHNRRTLAHLLRASELEAVGNT
jgi:hypothetical protein